MHSINPSEGGNESHPFFINTLSIYYRVILYQGRRLNKIIYYTPHEIILNLFAFKDDDTITYINKENNQELFTLTVDEFKVRIAETLYSVHNNLEVLYMRLLQSNTYANSIIDRGRFRQHDSQLRKYVLTLKGGYDSYLAYEKRSTVLYFKYRRLSSIQLLTVIEDWNIKTNIRFNHINIPQDIPNQGLLFDCLRISLNKNQFRVYNYHPVEEDNIQHIDISRNIIKVINQLIQ